MREASGKKFVAEWKVELGKKQSRKRTPKVLNQAVQHNPERLPPDFVFQLTISQCTRLSACDSSAPIVSARVRMVVRASCCSFSVSRDHAREMGHSES